MFTYENAVNELLRRIPEFAGCDPDPEAPTISFGLFADWVMQHVCNGYMPLFERCAAVMSEVAVSTDASVAALADEFAITLHDGDKRAGRPHYIGFKTLLTPAAAVYFELSISLWCRQGKK